MEESERIQKIMEADGATEPEARFLYHLNLAADAWWEAADARKENAGEANMPEAMQFSINYHNLQQMVYFVIHLREHPVEEQDS